MAHALPDQERYADKTDEDLKRVWGLLFTVTPPAERPKGQTPPATA